MTGIDILDIYFQYRIKDGMEGRFEEYVKSVLPVTESAEPYVLEYELFRHQDGTIMQHERYENESAITAHLQVTAEAQSAWGEAADLFEVRFIGNFSDDFREQNNFPFARWYTRFAAIHR